MRYCAFVVALLISGALCFANSGDAKSQVPGWSFRDCAAVCPQMIVIPAGDFTMGAAPGEEEQEGLPETIRGRSVPQHRVAIAAFAVGRYDVTRDEYAAFVSETNRSDPDKCYSETALGSGKSDWVDGRNWRNPGYPQTSRDPVVCVSGDDAQAYATWLSQKTGKHYRLLSESEWEYAARAKTTTARYWGEGTDDQCAYANGADQTAREKYSNRTVVDCRDGYVYTSPAGSFRPNAFGLYDMLGNVWQWTADCWNVNYDGAPTDRRAWTAGDCGKRASRGGSWVDKSAYVRAAIRVSDLTGDRNNHRGFRVAR